LLGESEVFLPLVRRVPSRQ